MITVYLQISGWAPAFATELASVLITPASLWFWSDLNEAIDVGVKQGDG